MNNLRLQKEKGQNRQCVRCYPKKSGMRINDLNKNLTSGKSHADVIDTVILLMKDNAISLPIYLLHRVQHAHVEYPVKLV